jgi:HEPN domain-containing protein
MSNKIGENIRTNSMGLWTQSNMYLNASKQLREHAPLKYSDPCYYLAAHALELSLKAYLRGCGMKIFELQNIGHDLYKCLQKARKVGLDKFFKFSNKEISALVLLNSYYVKKEFEYIKTGYRIYPELTLLQNTIAQLQNKIKLFCNQNRGIK